MAAAPLTSNHVNYLIWRYLQESGHDKTAARLKRDWRLADPEALPFARHIKTHALVSLVQKGLQYHELESSIQQHGDRATQSPTALFFGTDSAEAAPSREPNDNTGSLTQAPSSPRKHARESIVGGSGFDSTSQAPAAKRRRHAQNGASGASTTRSGDEMDIDQQQGIGNVAHGNDGGAELTDREFPNGKIEHQDLAPGFSPSEAHLTALPAAPTPSPPPVPTLENGSSVPTQTDSVIEVGSEVTQLLETEVEESSEEALLTAWNPHQPNLLVSGGDGLCRLFKWPVHFGDAPATNGSTLGRSPPQVHDLFESMNGASITALAWSPDGQQVAVARHLYESQTASWISLFDNTGAFEGELSQSQLYFLGLAYSPSGSFLLGYGGPNVHYEDGSRDYCLCVWDTSDAQATEPLTMRIAPRQEITGAAWLGDDTVVVCGPAYIGHTRLVDGQLQDWQPLLTDAVRGPVDKPHGWSMVASDKYSGTCVLSAAGSGVIALLSSDREQVTLRTAHDKVVTGLQYQPLPQHGSSGDGPRLVASASEDGTVKLWDAARELSLVKTLHGDSLQPQVQPIFAMQFSPDGSTLAAASYNKVTFWRPEKDGAWPSAQWALSTAMGWRTLGLANGQPDVNGDGPKSIATSNGANGHSRSNGTNGSIVNEGVQADQMSIDGEAEQVNGRAEDEESPATTLLWSAMGKKVAFGSRNQIAVADFTKAQLH